MQMPRVQVHACAGPRLTEPRAGSRLLTTFSDYLPLKALLITIFPLSPCCAWRVLTRSGTTRSLSISPCHLSPSHCLNPSTISPSHWSATLSRQLSISLTPGTSSSCQTYIQRQTTTKVHHQLSPRNSLRAFKS